MAKVLYSVTMSLDGYIAGPGGDMQWMTPYLGPNPEIDELVGRIGSLLVGRRTFDGDDPNKGGPGEGEAFGGGWSGPQYVVTHRVPDSAPTDLYFVDDFAGALSQAKQAAGDKYVNVLGADIARQCLEAGEARRGVHLHRAGHARRRCSPLRPPGRPHRLPRTAQYDGSASRHQLVVPRRVIGGLRDPLCWWT